MPRPKQFDPQASVDAAMQQFWEAGFARTSMDDLLRRTGLSRSSLYGTFRSKKELFEQVLRRYDDQIRRRELARLERTHPPLIAIRELFQGWVRRATRDGDTRGCLLVNTATELGKGTTGPGALVARTQADTEAFFARLLNAARKRGDIDPAIDIRCTARALLASLLGLLVLIRTRPEKALLDSIISSALAPLTVPAAAAGADQHPSGSPEGSTT